MNINKKFISEIIKKNIDIKISDSNKFFDLFLNIIKENIKNKNVKIQNFGTFHVKRSPERIGRNPLTNQEFIICERKRVSFKASNGVKKIIN